MINEEFFNIVKGRAIRWSTWSKDEYFIPYSIDEGGIMEGTFVSPRYNYKQAHWYSVLNGFSTEIGSFWILVGAKDFIVME